jgi:hypothetical protein
MFSGNARKALTMLCQSEDINWTALVMMLKTTVLGAASGNARIALNHGSGNLYVCHPETSCIAVAPAGVGKSKSVNLLTSTPLGVIQASLNSALTSAGVPSKGPNAVQFQFLVSDATVEGIVNLNQSNSEAWSTLERSRIERHETPQNLCPIPESSLVPSGIFYTGDATPASTCFTLANEWMSGGAGAAADADDVAPLPPYRSSNNPSSFPSVVVVSTEAVAFAERLNLIDKPGKGGGKLNDGSTPGSVATINACLTGDMSAVSRAAGSQSYQGKTTLLLLALTQIAGFLTIILGQCLGNGFLERIQLFSVNKQRQTDANSGLSSSNSTNICQRVKMTVDFLLTNGEMTTKTFDVSAPPVSSTDIAIATWEKIGKQRVPTVCEFIRCIFCILCIPLSPSLASLRHFLPLPSCLPLQSCTQVKLLRNTLRLIVVSSARKYMKLNV